MSQSGTGPTCTTAGFYAEHEIELRVDETVVDLDVRRRELALKSGERLGYDRLLLTTGADAAPAEHSRRGARRRPLPADARRQRRAAGAPRAGGRLVVIGAGWIGAEVAASARQRGVDVTIIASKHLN